MQGHANYLYNKPRRSSLASSKNTGRSLTVAAQLCLFVLLLIRRNIRLCFQSANYSGVSTTLGFFPYIRKSRGDRRKLGLGYLWEACSSCWQGWWPERAEGCWRESAPGCCSSRLDFGARWRAGSPAPCAPLPAGGLLPSRCGRSPPEKAGRYFFLEGRSGRQCFCGRTNVFFLGQPES